MNDPTCRQNMMNRQTRWIPAEVWQRQGMTAQEMTLPLDVVIPTSSSEKSNIVLKAGQKVMVLKSPKGIYMQLETGKIIAIRTAYKMNYGKEGKQDCEGGGMKKSLPMGQEMSDSETLALAGQNMPNAAEDDRVIDLDKDVGNGGESLDDFPGTKTQDINQFQREAGENNSSSEANPGGFGVGKYLGSSIGNQGHFVDQGSATIRPAPNEPINQGGMNNNYAPYATLGQKIDGKNKGNSSDGSEMDKSSDDVIMLSPEPAECVTDGGKRPATGAFESSPFANQGYHQFPPYQQHYNYGNHGQSQYYSHHQQMPHQPPNPYNAPGQIPPGNPSATQTSFPPPPSSQNPAIPPTITIDDDNDPPMRQKTVYKPNLVGRSKKPPQIPPQPYGMAQQMPPQQNYPPSGPNSPFPTHPASSTKAGYRLKSPTVHHRMPPAQHQSQMTPYYKQPPAYRSSSTTFESYGNPTGDYQQSSLSCLERTTSAIDESKSMYKASLSNITNSAPLSPTNPQTPQLPINPIGNPAKAKQPKPRNRRKANSKSPALPIADGKPDSPARKVSTPKSPKGTNGPPEVTGNTQNQQHLLPGQYNPSHPPYYTTPLEPNSYQNPPAQQLNSRHKDTTPGHFGGKRYWKY